MFGREGKLSKGGWSTTGKLFTPSAAGVRDLSSIKGQCQFPQAEYYTVKFGINQPVDGAGNLYPSSTLAEVVWSTAGNSVRRLINIVNGMVLAGTAEAVTIRMFDNSPIGLGAGGSFPYVVTALVTPGVRPSIQLPPYLAATGGTIGGVPVPPGDTYGSYLVPIGGFGVSIPIPLDAGVISANIIVGTNGSLGDPLFIPAPRNTLIANFAFFSGAFPVGFYDPRDFAEWVPIPPGASHLILVDAQTAGPHAYPYTWDVMWGIEG